MFSKKATKIDEIFTVDLKLCTYLVSAKSTVKISSIFVATLENTNFMIFSFFLVSIESLIHAKSYHSLIQILQCRVWMSNAEPTLKVYLMC